MAMAGKHGDGGAGQGVWGRRMAELMEAMYKAVPKQGKPQGHERTVLAGFVGRM